MLLELSRTRYPARAAASVTYAPKVALVAVLCLAAVLRFIGRDWDDGQYLHPDERFITMVATGISWPSGIGEYFDSATSPLNPYNNEFGSYVYGTFPLFLAKLTGDLLGYNVYGDFHLAGRSLSATFDLLTVLLVFLIGRRLFGEWTGMLAALLLSLTVLHIQLSHFVTTDAYRDHALPRRSSTWRCGRTTAGGGGSISLAGVAAGLAVATKLSALPIVAVLALPRSKPLRLRRLARRSGAPRGPAR